MVEKKKIKQLVVNCESLETRVALLSDGKLEQYEIEREEDRTEAMSGSVYLGKISNLEASLQAAFVDIGAEKNAFLHYWDMQPTSYDKSDSIKEETAATPKKKSSFSDKVRGVLTKKKGSEIKRLEQRRRSKKISDKEIPKMFPKNSKLLVQVSKGPIGTKGARVTTNLSIPGRYLVLLPYSDHIGLSKKIEDRTERKRLKKILGELDVPEGMGLICRTVGEGRKSAYFKRDLDMLLDLWHEVEVQLEKPKAPKVVYQEPTLLQRTVRDFLTEDIDEVVVDDVDAYKLLQNQLNKLVGRKTARKVTLYKKSQPLFQAFGVKKLVEKIYEREAHLPSGGYICIDETEALIAIDINSGRSRKGKNQAETTLTTNLEACDEIARQLKVRNIGGLVVIDFIDMKSAKDREKVLRHMRRLVKQDRAKSKILPISRLGLMEMTRQREHQSLQDTVFDPCPYCSGRGRVKSAYSMSVEIQRRLQHVLKKTSRKELAVRIIMHPTILNRLKTEDATLFDEFEEKYGKDLTFRADEAVHMEDFKLVDAETGAEL